MTSNSYTLSPPYEGIADEVEADRGYESDADAYVYVLSFVRRADDRIFYYVGMTEDGSQGVKRRARVQARGREFVKPVLRDGTEQMRSCPGTYEFLTIEQIKSFSDLAPREIHVKEWQTRGQTMQEKNTHRVLGGR